MVVPRWQNKLVKSTLVFVYLKIEISNCPSRLLLNRLLRSYKLKDSNKVRSQGRAGNG